jgi:transcriptional regulator
MYIPKINAATDKDEVIAFMKQFSFATIVTAKDNVPIATHLPFLVSAQDHKIILAAHFARANEQWQDIENNNVLVIFSEPHAYISPTNYEKELNVPTWNYISVHAYGQGRLITETKDVFRVLENTINSFESAYKEQWDKFPMEYKLKMSKGIVAFDITVTDLQAKKKLSQNRSDIEKQNIIDSLSKSEDTNEQLIAAYMKKDQ